MDVRARWEIGVLMGLALVFTVWLVPAVQWHRREVRDGIRREEATQVKNRLAEYFNEHEVYPLTFDASPHAYVVAEEREGQASAWYVRARLENYAANRAAFDFEGGHNYYYRIINEGETTYFDICGGTLTCGVPRHD